MEFRDRLKLLEIASTLSENEADRFWRRFGTMLVVNGGLIILFTATTDSNPIFLPIITGMMGIILAIIWYLINIKSIFLEQKWYKDMVAIIDSNENISKYLHGKSEVEKPRVKEPHVPATTKSANMIVIIIGLLWTTLVIFSVRIWISQ